VYGFGPAITAYAFTAPTDLYYSTNDNTIEIDGYDEFTGVVHVPPFITGLPVTSVAERAFSESGVFINILNWITLPNTITNVGASAFEYCYALTNILLPNSILTIGDSCFYQCGSLSGVEIPIELTTVSSDTFWECGNLNNISIPNKVRSIDEGAFSASGLTNIWIGSGVTNIFVSSLSCGALLSIDVDPANSYYSSKGGVLFDKGGTTLLQFPCGLGGVYTVPSGVSGVGDSAFENCNISNIILAASVQSIGAYSFAYCGQLDGVYFLGNAPAGVSGVFYTSFDQTYSTIYYLPGTTGWNSFLAAVGHPGATWDMPYPLILNGNTAFGVHEGQFSFSISWATNSSVVI
jgi:hypothetical protein